MSTILNRYRPETGLTDEDMKILEELGEHLQELADISQADVFIDCLLPGQEAALVIAHARPTTANSLYHTPVVGQVVYAANEPGVFYTLKSGKPVIGSKGLYPREHVIMQQNIVPVKNKSGRTIGALITEQDIYEKVQQEKNVEVLRETTEQLSETLLALALSESKVTALLHEGIILFDDRDVITFANNRAQQLMKDLGCDVPIIGMTLPQSGLGGLTGNRIKETGGMICEEFQKGKFCVQLKAISIYRKNEAVGGILLLRDISEIKEKDKQLMIKSAVIKEIHHRVKNNLQTIASLLRLQMRRTHSADIEKNFS